MLSRHFLQLQHIKPWRELCDVTPFSSFSYVAFALVLYVVPGLRVLIVDVMELSLYLSNESPLFLCSSQFLKSMRLYLIEHPTACSGKESLLIRFEVSELGRDFSGFCFGNMGINRLPKGYHSRCKELFSVFGLCNDFIPMLGSSFLELLP